MKHVQYVRIGPHRTEEKVVAGRRRWKIGTSQPVQYGRIGGDRVASGRIEVVGPVWEDWWEWEGLVGPSRNSALLQLAITPIQLSLWCGADHINKNHQ